MANRTTDAPPLIELRGIERTFVVGQARVHALDRIDLDIARGEFIAIWGPSGSGKSTLLNVLGLIDSADRGQHRFEAADVATLSDEALADYRGRKIGFVFQGFNLIPVLTALENVMLPLQLQGVPDAHARARAAEWLGKVGVGDLKDFRPDKLSGGQRQRVALARALVGSPSLLIADEPTANLDSRTSHEVIDLIQQLNQELGVTCVFATHDPRLLARVRRQLKMQDGTLSEIHYDDRPF